MKRILIVVLSCLLISSFAFAEWTTGGKSGTEPDGFRGIKWGTSIDDLAGMEYLETDPSYGGTLKYTKSNENLKIEAANLFLVKYGFWQGKFCSASIYTINPVNWYGLKEATFEKFGAGYQDNKYIKTFDWFGTRTMMMLEYSEITEQGTLFLFSPVINEQQEAWKKRKAREGAEGGF